MGISVSCTVCERTFADIDESMIGKKARCTCGTVVVLVVEEDEELELLELEPLEDVHLEPLDDEPLIADSVGQSRASITLTSGRPASPGIAEPIEAKPIEAKPIESEPLEAEPLVVEPIGGSAASAEQIPDEPIVLDATAIESSPVPEVSVKQVPAPPKPTMKSRATSGKRRKPSDKPRSRSDRPSGSNSGVAESPPVRSKKKSGKKRAGKDAVDRPVIADSFGDVDDILNGGVDGSPVRAKPKPIAQPPVVAASSPNSKAPNSKANATRSGAAPEIATGPSVSGFISIFGGAAGVCFGAIALATKQLPFSDSVLSWLGEPMHGMYQAAYGQGQVEGMFRALFLSLGWTMILVALVSIVAGLCLAARGLLKVVANSNQFGWSRAFAAIVGVTGLFLVVSILLTQYSHNDHLVSQLDNSGAVGLVDEPQQFQRLREQYAEDKERFSIAMLFMASMPLALAVSSAVGLFCDRD